MGNGADIGGYNVIISGPDDGCGVRGVPQFTAGEEYRCAMPSVGETYTFGVSAVCGTLEGTAAEDSITLRGTIWIPFTTSQLLVGGRSQTPPFNCCWVMHISLWAWCSIR